MVQKSSIIRLRIPAEKFARVEAAARLTGKSVEDFILKHALRDAADVVLGARVFRLNRAQTRQLDKLFANPPQPTDALRRLMGQPALWESKL